jgi:hypothetical protein
LVEDSPACGQKKILVEILYNVKRMPTSMASLSTPVVGQEREVEQEKEKELYGKLLQLQVNYYGTGQTGGPKHNQRR